jgi:hypothetical protein
MSVRQAALASLLIGPCTGNAVADGLSVARALRDATHPLSIARSERWMSWGGDTTLVLDPDSLDDRGLALRNITDADSAIHGERAVRRHELRFLAKPQGSLEYLAPNGVLDSLQGGALTHRGGFVLDYAGGRADLRGFILRPRAGSAFGMELTDAGGTVWFTLDHGHARLDRGSGRLEMLNMNLRLSAAFAEQLGHPQWSGQPVGGAHMHSYVFVQSAQNETIPLRDCGVPSPNPFPGPGLATDIQMIHYDDGSGVEGQPDSIYARHCGIPNGTGYDPCTAGSTNGLVVFIPDSSLQNVGTTAVPWFEKFNQDQAPEFPDGVPQPPYNNDQHPFLVWNLYRIDAAGGIRQLGASGVKHAFYTVNWNCDCNGGHYILSGCSDTYSQFNNDSPSVLGPRSEIIPASGLWGRCGSVYDADCNGVQDSGAGAHDDHQYRLQARESDLLPASNPGASYYVEYWYVVRDDQNIYNTMASRRIVPNKTGVVWDASIAAPIATNFNLGPALNLWVDPSAPAAGAMNQELASAEGHARVAVKTTALGGGVVRYRYAVMNLDFARGVVDPLHNTAPNLKVLSALGFNRFEIPLPAGVTVSNIGFSDVDTNAANEWAATVGSGFVRWVAPAGNELNWGTLYTFSFDASSVPVSALTTLGVATAGAPGSYLVASLAPSPPDAIFADGFGP